MVRLGSLFKYGSNQFRSIVAFLSAELSSTKLFCYSKSFHISFQRLPLSTSNHLWHFDVYFSAIKYSFYTYVLSEILIYYITIRSFCPNEEVIPLCGSFLILVARRDKLVPNQSMVPVLPRRRRTLCYRKACYRHATDVDSEDSAATHISLSLDDSKFIQSLTSY